MDETVVPGRPSRFLPDDAQTEVIKRFCQFLVCRQFVRIALSAALPKPRHTSAAHLRLTFKRIGAAKLWSACSRESKEDGGEDGEALQRKEEPAADSRCGDRLPPKIHADAECHGDPKILPAVNQARRRADRQIRSGKTSLPPPEGFRSFQRDPIRKPNRGPYRDPGRPPGPAPKLADAAAAFLQLHPLPNGVGSLTPRD